MAYLVRSGIGVLLVAGSLLARRSDTTDALPLAPNKYYPQTYPTYARALYQLSTRPPYWHTTPNVYYLNNNTWFINVPFFLSFRFYFHTTVTYYTSFPRHAIFCRFLVSFIIFTKHKYSYKWIFNIQIYVYNRQ